ncbi:hypothetical protein BDV95DRAFT_212387 [Massariosphaeria phaeospora]|uniref:Mitochondrial carrier domain-containing protein n=1 Tax=Massariosphaeria phaeospora TaxID=100035 RepID=A0A7C8HZD2_9PLEO|nr:hypothetical protein BDV95DRAFT_212387 [Massariosphaeria phaeospora]
MPALTKQVSASELRKSQDVKTTTTLIRYPFWFGGSASCFAAFFTHPLDLVKVFRIRIAHRERAETYGSRSGCRLRHIMACG